MSISEKEMKLLMNFVKDDLKEARESEDIEKKNSKMTGMIEAYPAVFRGLGKYAKGRALPPLVHKNKVARWRRF